LSSRTDRNNPGLCDRRTLVVWASLVASMTAASGLLLLLEPAPLAPTTGLALAAVDSSGSQVQNLVNDGATSDAHPWQAIVIHHSGADFGNGPELGRAHQARGYGGLGFHFVLGNGEGAGDGEIQVGYRWARQLPGVHVFGGDAAAWYNRHAIGICLVGDGDRTPPTAAQLQQLVRLVTALQQRFEIPADRVRLNSNIAPAGGPGLLFPASAFRMQLLQP